MFRRDSAFSQTLYPFCLLILTQLINLPAYGAGYVRFDSSGFLRHADDRGDSISSVIVGPEMSAEGKVFSAAMDLKGVAFLSDRSSFTVEAGNLYVATSPQLMPHHQITLGRRIYDWSEMEDVWGLGLWSARFLWNPFKPERIGLTGGFYTYESAKWRILAFASPLSPPERGYPIRNDKGKLSSPSPDWIPPYEGIVLMNQPVDIHYTIQYPPMSDLLFRPGAGVQVRYGAKEGFWTAGSYGIMPMHEVQLAVDAGITQAGYVDAIIHPRTLFHHLVTGETGYRGQLWSLWASATGESPLQKATPANWVTDPIGPSLLTSAGGDMRLDKFFTLSASYLGVDEDKPPRDANTIPLNQPSRFEYSRAFQVEGKWTGIQQLLADLHWIYDLDGSSSLLSFDLIYQTAQKRSGILNAMFGGVGAWTYGVGTDVISSASGTGFIGQYVGNDRVRGRISYAF